MIEGIVGQQAADREYIAALREGLQQVHSQNLLQDAELAKLREDIAFKNKVLNEYHERLPDFVTGLIDGRMEKITADFNVPHENLKKMAHDHGIIGRYLEGLPGEGHTIEQAFKYLENLIIKTTADDHFAHKVHEVMKVSFVKDVNRDLGLLKQQIELLAMSMAASAQFAPAPPTAVGGQDVGRSSRRALLRRIWPGDGRLQRRMLRRRPGSSWTSRSSSSGLGAWGAGAWGTSRFARRRRPAELKLLGTAPLVHPGRRGRQ